MEIRFVKKKFSYRNLDFLVYITTLAILNQFFVTIYHFLVSLGLEVVLLNRVLINDLRLEINEFIKDIYKYLKSSTHLHNYKNSLSSRSN